MKFRDLEAQEEMAKWAFWMLIASVSGSLLTVIGLGFVWRTLHHTRRSADYAEQAIEQNRQSINKQLRAYVGPANVTYHYNAETEAILVTADIKNFGNTPAYKFRTRVTLTWMPFPVTAFPDISCADSDENILFSTAQTSAAITLPVQGDRIDLIRNGSNCFFLSIVLEYDDFTGQSYREKSGLYITGLPNSTLWNSSHSAGMNFLYGTSQDL